MSFTPITIFIIAAIILVGVVLLGALLISLERRVRRFFRFMITKGGVDKEAVRRDWIEVENLIRSKESLKWQSAIISADSLLDRVLKERGMIGNSMGERLRFAVHKYAELRKVWWAHRLRNQLVHEHNVKLNHRQARGAIRVYRKALRALGAL